MKKALFPGSFDPVTRGHVDIVDRGLALFDEVIVALGENSQKKYMFSIEERLEMLRLAFQDKPRVKVTSYDVLTDDIAKENGAKFLLRGIQGSGDLVYERPIAVLNKYLSGEIETVYLLAEAEFADISSTLVREVIRYGRDPEGLVPAPALKVVREMQNRS